MKTNKLTKAKFKVGDEVFVVRYPYEVVKVKILKKWTLKHFSEDDGMDIFSWYYDTSNEFFSEENDIFIELIDAQRYVLSKIDFDMETLKETRINLINEMEG